MQRFLLSCLSFFVLLATAQSQTLIHYWNFNVISSESAHLAPSFSLGGAAITYTAGGTSAIDLAGGTGNDFDILNLNARNGDPAGNHFRLNNPIGASLVFSLPTSGYNNIQVKYATRRSGSGAGNQQVEYTADGSNYTFFVNIAPNNGSPTLQTLDFSGISAVNNNPNFKIRFTFSVGSGGTVGNNRFDNITTEGNPLGADVLPPSVSFSPIAGSIDIAPDVNPTITFNEPVRKSDNTSIDNNNVDGLVVLKLNNSTGVDVAFDASIAGNSITINPTANLNPNQQYYVAVKANAVEDISDNAIVSEVSATFTTISTQTIFNPGDLLLVAYQMNSVPNNDRIAFVTFVNILPGTKINFTDAKFTSNVPAQCPGGLTWTAPAEGVAAGTVITINNDAATTDKGTLTGSGFGLSANGDQIIVYTGTNDNPNFITALSSNAWALTNTSCSGSFSLLPSGLADAVTAINLSTSPGNITGNTVNAYYAGAMNAAIPNLKALISNPANWVGSASGTPAQTWPTWAFPGPPIVTSARVINNSTLQVIFNRDLDAVSSVDINNFTGIANLSVINRTQNGGLNDTLTLTYSVPFNSGSSYSLTISNVKDSENRTMFTPYVFNFTYNTTITFKVSTLSVSEATGQAIVELTLNNPSAASVDLVVKSAPFSSALAGTDFTFQTQTFSFTGTSNSTQLITIPINNDGDAEQDEYFVLTLENPSGVSITGNSSITVFIRDNDKQAPIASKKIELNYVGSYDPSGGASASSEIVAYDSASKRLFSISALQDRLDIADFSNPSAITPVTSINMAPYGGITSVAIKNGIVAVSSPNVDEQQNGSVVFFNTDGVFQKLVTVGALPDMIVFTPDGLKVLTANEGQPNDSYTVDPEGSVSIIDISGGIASLSQANVTTVGFTAFNGQEAALIAAGFRKVKPEATLSQDVEPEYITISDDSKTAWVVLQEANSIAVIDLVTKNITDIWSLGKKDHNLPGNGFDASDLGGFDHIANWPVKGLYMPDGIASFKLNGTSFIVGANEGDDREYSAFNERVRLNAATYVLDPVKFPNAAILKQDNNLGRLRVTKATGDTDGDGDFDEINLIGGRSFSIWNADTKALVYDSKDDFEQYLSKTPAFTSIFNADHESNTRKSRSSSKGPEPEGLALASISGNRYAFISLERVGGVMVYDISDPNNVNFVDYKNPRNVSSYGGDNGPEGIIYISDSISPDGKGYVIVANEISGTLSIYSVTNNNINKAPQVTITNPTNGSSAPAGVDVTVQATALDADGTVRKVEFFYIDNNITYKLGEDSTLPFEIVANDVEPGNYKAFAKATDNKEAIAYSDTINVTVNGCIGTGSITAEGFANIPGGAVTDLTNNPSYPSNPTITAQLGIFETPDNLADQYGIRLRGYICAPITGNYTFYISSDEQSELWLSTDDNPANKIRIAFLNNAVGPRVWTAYASQKSAPIKLIRGARYYVEVLHKENAGNDNLAVGWVRPDGAEEGPIPGKYLSPWTNAPGVIPAGNLITAADLVTTLNAGTALRVRATPNPTSDQFSLVTNCSNDEKLTLVLTDVTGRVLDKRSSLPANGTIKLGSTLAPGMYFVRITQGKNIQTLKLIKK